MTFASHPGVSLGNLIKMYFRGMQPRFHPSPEPTVSLGEHQPTLTHNRLLDSLSEADLCNSEGFGAMLRDKVHAHLTSPHLTSPHLISPSLTFPHLTPGCGRVISLTFPKTVTSVGSEAFYACAKLTSITLPRTLTNIGDSSFYSCFLITSIVVLPTWPLAAFIAWAVGNSRNRNNWQVRLG